jgi:NhaA family Na+:H+ antiporter
MFDDELRKFGDNIRRFMRLESAGGVTLLAAAVLAMILKNSPLGDSYVALLEITAEVRVGSLGVDKPLFLWINDGLMAVFFFLVGMEIKREAVEGYLSERSQIVLPGLAALGGMIVPAAIYVACTWGDSQALAGWAIPTATDIAFALGVLALLGTRAPVALKVFLMTLAILDDLGAIIVIALFYTADLSLGSLGVAAVACSVLAILNRLGVKRIAPFIVTGLILWTAVLKSGVHATLAGVVTGLAIPARAADEHAVPPLRHLVHELHPWVAFGILPLFAFANAGVALGDFNVDKLLSPLPLGIIAGLFIGKQLGVFAFAALAIRLGLARLPTGTSWTQLYGAAVLCGIGFTMSLFIGGLAFAEAGVGYARADRLAIIIGSLVSGLLGYGILRFASARTRATEDSG